MHLSPVVQMTQENSKMRKGRIVIIGPDLPAGKKISGHERAKVEVFRGALRPFATTVNQELSDVLKSNVRIILNFAWNCRWKRTQ